MKQVYIDPVWLMHIQKPARYIGGEWNSVVKDHDSVDLHVALAFPDVYEVAMSHLGLKIIYSVINKRSDALAERVYAPWVDMEALMKENRSRCIRWNPAARSVILMCLVLRCLMKCAIPMC